ncbi:MAG: putative Signal transduction histidine kinase [Rhodospirillales bacterium]|jgi:two-component system osmolarity sensor histidine kinase EnvZ|nr:putative Signal transduction histidine kinase [Rhodospirillales bacterium]
MSLDYDEGEGRVLRQIVPRSLLGRSLLIIVTPLILLQVVSAWAFYERHWDNVTKRLANSVAGDISTVIALREQVGPAQEAELLRTAGEAMDLTLSIEPGQRLAAAPPPASDRLIDRMLARALNERVGRPYLMDTISFTNQVEVKIQLEDGVLHAVVPLNRLFSSSSYVFILYMVGTSLVLFAVATVFMRNQVWPLRRLATAADRFGKGQDVPDFKPQGATEVRLAAAAFNRMRARIQRQITQRTEMLAGVSHDLRTPLTRMKLQLAMLGDATEIEELKGDVAEMERMVEGYLAFARGEGTEKPAETDLGLLLRDVVGDARREGTAVDLHVEDRLVALVRPNALRRCLVNLVSNAARFASQVWIRAGQVGDMIEITVDDDGPGIPADRREDVFKPFFRLEGSRNPMTGGTGLGLTIARDVIRSHGGDLVLLDAPTGGLRARLSLPL